MGLAGGAGGYGVQNRIAVDFLFVVVIELGHIVGHNTLLCGSPAVVCAMHTSLLAGYTRHHAARRAPCLCMGADTALVVARVIPWRATTPDEGSVLIAAASASGN